MNVAMKLCSTKADDFYSDTCHISVIHFVLGVSQVYFFQRIRNLPG